LEQAELEAQLEKTDELEKKVSGQAELEAQIENKASRQAWLEARQVELRQAALLNRMQIASKVICEAKETVSSAKARNELEEADHVRLQSALRSGVIKFTEVAEYEATHIKPK